MADYTVQPGDTLWAIARDLGIPLGALQEANPGIQPTKMQAGTILKMPNTNPGTTQTIFDPQTNRGGVNPFAMFPTPGAGSTGSWSPSPGTLQPAGAMGMTQPLSPEETASPFLTPADMYTRAGKAALAIGKGVLDVAKYPGEVYSGKKSIQQPNPITGEAEFTDEAIGRGTDLAALTMTGGVGGTPKTSMPKGEPLPMGEPRNLPMQQKATGTMGLLQRAEKAGALNDPGIDPMWIDTVVNRQPPTGNVKMPTFSEMTVGSGPVRDGNVVRPDFNAPRVPKDPKANLERRMARRTGEGEVLPLSRWDQAQVDKYARQASVREDLGLLEPNPNHIPSPAAQAAAKRAGYESGTHEWQVFTNRYDHSRVGKLTEKQKGQAARNQKAADLVKASNDVTVGQGPLSMGRLRDKVAKWKAGRPLAQAQTASQLERRIKQLKDLLNDLPDFPVVAGGVIGAGAAAPPPPDYGLSDEIAPRRGMVPDRPTGNIKRTPAPGWELPPKSYFPKNPKNDGA